MAAEMDKHVLLEGVKIEAEVVDGSARHVLPLMSLARAEV